MKKRELKELIEQGEGYFVEFKEQIGVSFDKEMVAFANASIIKWNCRTLLGMDNKPLKGVAQKTGLGPDSDQARWTMHEIRAFCRLIGIFGL